MLLPVFLLLQMLLDTGEIMEMTDKDWLQRVSIAYKAYQYPNKDIEAFISWLYKQYGIVEQKDKE